MNKSSIVSITACEKYDYELVYESVKKAVDSLGGMSKYIKKGDKVVVKPNLILMKKPEMCATTHPFLLKAVLELILECDADVTIAESPGGIYKEKYLDAIYNVCGIKKVAEELGVKLNYDLSYENVNFEVNGNSRNSEIIKPILDADVIINLPKLKTHVMSNYTGGVKNLYGTVPGVTKANYHFKYSDKETFFSFVTDLTTYLKPTLTIADAIDIMEGDGPTNGTGRHLGLILASENPFNLDLIGHTIFGFNENDIFTSKFGKKYGFQPESADEVNTVGESFKDYLISDIKKPNVHTSTFDERIPKFLRKPLKKYLAPYPKFLHKRCIKCSNCVTVCPAKTLKLGANSPEFIDKSKCIRCYCCHEMCPKNAVKLRKLPKILQ